MNFRSFANRFVILLVVLALLLPGVVLAQTDEPVPTLVETITFETNTPAVTATEAVVTAEATPVPVVTEVPVTPVPDDPVDEPDPGTPGGISEATLNSVVGMLVWAIIAMTAIIVVLIIVTGLVQGKSIHELARSQPVQWGVTAAANAALLTPDTTDDEWIAARARQLGWDVVKEDGVITLKKVDIPPISLPVG